MLPEIGRWTEELPRSAERRLSEFIASRPRGDEERGLAERLQALPIYRGWGGTLFLGTDGRILSWDAETDAVAEEADPGWRMCVVVEAAALYPELTALLPIRTDKAVQSPLCHGTGKVVIESRVLDIGCGRCWGLRWILRP